MAITSIGSPYQVQGGYGNSGGVGPMISGLQNNIWGTPGAWPQYIQGPVSAGGNFDTGAGMSVYSGNNPLNGPDGSWNGQQILNTLNQLNAPGVSPAVGGPDTTIQGSQECAQASLLGAAVMAGPQATAQLAQNMSESSFLTNPDQQANLQNIAQNIWNGTGTNNDLSQLQQYMAQAFNSGTGTSASSIGLMENQLAPQDVSLPGISNDTTLLNPSQTQDLLNGLNPGQSVILGVSTVPGLDPGHAVLAGTDENGNPYVYDPQPADNQPNVVTPTDNPDAYSHYIDGSAGLNGQNAVAGDLVTFPTTNHVFGSGTLQLPEITITGDPNAPPDDSVPADPAPDPDAAPAPAPDPPPSDDNFDDGGGGGDF